jgi:ATP-binding cassette subfamily B multidrug efflux pump
MLRLVRYLRDYVKECVLAPLFKLLEAAFGLAVPLIVAQVIDEGVRAGDTGLITRSVILMVVLTVVGLVCAITAQYFAAKLSAGFGTRLRDDLFAHIMSLAQADIDELGGPTLITRVTNDTLQVQNGVFMFFRLILRSPFVVFGSMAMAFVIDGTQGLIFLVAIVALFAIVFLVMRVAIRRYAGVQAALDRIVRRTQENLDGVRSIRAFRREGAEQAAFGEENDALYGLQVAVGKVSALMNPLTYMGINLCLIAVIATGAVQVGVGTLQQGEVVALINYVSQVLVELIKLADLIVLLSRSSASAERLNEVFDTSCSMADGTQDASGADGSVAFRDVSFSYPLSSTPSLAHVSFEAAPGDTVGVIGGTGSGKTTLARLLVRTYDASEGEVSLGGRDIRDYSLATLRDACAVVEQDVRMFSGTIESNLRMGAGPDAPAGELERAAALAQASDVLASKPEGLEAAVEEGGRNLSGGQRQRLSIARALARKPRLLVLDDASSALDFATEARLRHVLSHDLSGTTLVVISQRVSAIRHADRIVVLDDGAQVGYGTHDELLDSCPVYRQICLSQLPEEEVSGHGED